jgi:hypothetical protein
MAMTFLCCMYNLFHFMHFKSIDMWWISFIIKCGIKLESKFSMEEKFVCNPILFSIALKLKGPNFNSFKACQ